jgi:tetratricopeptide (TPR) repeat protein
MKHLRLYRGGIAVLVALACALVAVILAVRVGLAADNWAGLVAASLAMLVAAFLAIATSRRAIALMSSNGRGLSAFNAGRYADAEARFRHSWELAQALAEDDPCRGDVLEHLVRTARVQGNYDDAESFGQL